MPEQKAPLRRAAGYIRESTDEQTEFSPEAQRKALFRFAAQNGYILDERHIYSDEGISGKAARKRPGFQSMIAAAKSPEHPFDVILVWKFSRFARNQEESIVYKSMLKRDGVEVISVTEPVIEGPFGSLIERIIEWMDEYYSIRLAEEVKKGMTEKARRGGLQSAPPFGFAVENNRLVPIPAEAALVREIFRRFLGGYGLYQLAKWLNGQGAVTHRGNSFENRTVEYILRNPAYIGRLRWNPAGRTRRDFKNRNIILSEAEHEPIIDRETWESAQRRLDAMKSWRARGARPTAELKDWPSGLVRCATCGGTLIFVKPHYYKCNNYIRGRCATSQHVRADLLKEAIEGRLYQDMGFSLPLKAELCRAPKPVQDELANLKTRAEDLEKKKRRLRSAYLNGAETLEEYRSGKKELEEALSDVYQRIQELKKQPQEGGATALPESAVRAALSLEALNATLEEKHNAALSVIESCTWDKARNLIEIVYRDFL